VASVQDTSPAGTLRAEGLGAASCAEPERRMKAPRSVETGRNGV
jgi:hypothetical protein